MEERGTFYSSQSQGAQVSADNDVVVWLHTTEVTGVRGLRCWGSMHDMLLRAGSWQDPCGLRSSWVIAICVLWYYFLYAIVVAFVRGVGTM